MVYSCCARFCTNRATEEAREKGIHFYRIPQAIEKRKLWLAALKRKDYNPGPNTYAVFNLLVVSSSVCSIS